MLPTPRPTRRFHLAACALAAALLAACGGGGGSDGGSVLPDVQPQPVNPSVPAASYTDASQLALYQQLNTVRLGAGAGAARQDVRLDRSAAKHLDYLRINGVAAGHGEQPGLQGYTGSTPGARVTAAGYAWSIVSEDLAWGTAFTPLQCLDLLLSSVYHLASLMGEQVDMGVAYGPAGGVNGCVFNFGVPLGGAAQLPASGVVKAYPYPGQRAVATTFVPATESPNPMPDVGSRSVGQPVFVSMRALGASDGAGYTVSAFTLRDAAGTAVAARLIANATSGPGVTADPVRQLRAGEVFLVPLSPLAPGSTYTASFSGRNGSVPYAATWQFTTR
ncbi:CAP domain-containing protein [Azohydromonas australica]|uniref:CAP domain-containing protein n=1 Tax=Azohydromonas australica TaxID=364039 RepID=UPI0004192906|nr:CAP domain-containing protein [Azohydromonas australica]